MIGSKSSGRKKPDILVVVLDCVRSKSVSPWNPEGIQVPFLHELSDNATVYTRCLSVASWSLPAHASLFTGMYPWNHRVFGRGARSLDSRFSTLAERLAEAGYRTLSLSANPFISRKTDLTRGFDTAYWGDWASHYMRFLGSEEPPEGFAPTSPEERSDIRLQGLGRRMAVGAVNAAHSGFPQIWKWSSMLESRLRSRSGGGPRLSSPWIEPCLKLWLDSVGGSEPVCCFVNLMDAHEPYLGLPSSSVDEEYTTKILLDGLDRGKLDSNRDSELIRELERRYIESIRMLDNRLRGIVKIFSSQRDPNSSMTILTSDHGQSFGEGGHLFHGRNTGSQLLRVPLVVGYPAHEHAGLVSDSWASLVDIAPTILDSAGLSTDTHFDGISLSGLIQAKREEPVFAIGDGITLFREVARTDEVEIAGRDRVTLLGFLDETSVEISQPDWRPEFRIVTPANEEGSTFREERVILPIDQTPGSRILVEQLSSIRRSLGEADEVEGRLSGWGY